MTAQTIGAISLSRSMKKSGSVNYCKMIPDSTNIEQESGRFFRQTAYDLVINFIFVHKKLTLQPGRGKDHPGWILRRLEMHGPAAIGCLRLMGDKIVDTELTYRGLRHLNRNTLWGLGKMIRYEPMNALRHSRRSAFSHYWPHPSRRVL